MKNIKVILLSALAFIIITSLVFVSCQKQQELVTTTTKVKKSRTIGIQQDPLFQELVYKIVNQGMMVPTNNLAFIQAGGLQTILGRNTTPTDADLHEFATTVGFENIQKFYDYNQSVYNLHTTLKNKYSLDDIALAEQIATINYNDIIPYLPNMNRCDRDFGVCVAGVVAGAYLGYVACLATTVAMPLCMGAVYIAQAAGELACLNNYYNCTHPNGSPTNPKAPDFTIYDYHISNP